MQAQLNRIESKINKLIVAMEHRMTAIETTQRNVKWFIGIMVIIGAATQYF